MTLYNAKTNGGLRRLDWEVAGALFDMKDKLTGEIINVEANVDFAIIQWKAYVNKSASPFYTALFDAIAHADNNNRIQLSKGFPAEVIVYIFAQRGKVFN